jgi:hypothetical protein
MKELGLELHFAEISPITSKYNSYNAEETVSRIASELIMPQRLRLCYAIRRKLRELLSSSYNVRELIPPQVVELASLPILGTAEYLSYLIPFFEWLQDLQRDNENARVRRIAAVNDVTARIGGEAGRFVSSFSALTGQVVSVVQKGDDVYISNVNSLWGKASLHLNSAEFEGELPVFGFANWMEADVITMPDGSSGYEFRLTLDTEFSSEAARRRILQNKNWAQVSIRTSKVDFSFELYNYAQRLSLFGEGVNTCLFGSLMSLIQKAAVLGEEALSDCERELLHFAKLLDCYDLLRNQKRRLWLSVREEQLMELVENRFAYQRMLGTLRRLADGSAEGLLKILTAIAENYDSDEPESNAFYLRQVGKLLNRWIALSGELRHLGKGIVKLLGESCTQTELESNVSGVFKKASSSIKAELEPCLKEMGFEGSYPNYRRQKGKEAQFITIACNPLSEVPGGGFYRMYFSIKLAKDTLDRKGTILNLPYTELNASDFERTGRLYTQIADKNDEGADIIQYSYLNNEFDGGESFAKDLKRYLGVAFSALNGKPLPKFYVRKHLGKKHAKANIPALIALVVMLAVLGFHPLFLDKLPANFVPFFEAIVIIWLVGAFIFVAKDLKGIWRK